MRGPVWTDSEHLVPTGIRFLDRPARGKSLNRLRYTGPRLPREYIKSQEDGYLPHRLELITGHSFCNPSIEYIVK